MSEHVFTFNAIRAYDQDGEKAIIFVDPPGIGDGSGKYKLRLLHSQGARTFYLHGGEIDGLIELLTIARSAEKNG